MSVYYHGGAPDLMPGSYVLPPSMTGVETLTTLDKFAWLKMSQRGADFLASLQSKYRRDRIYVTPDVHVALMFAVQHPSNAGLVYEVFVEGDLEDDPDWPDDVGDQIGGHSKQCERALVLSVIQIDPLSVARARQIVRQAGAQKMSAVLQPTNRKARRAARSIARREVGGPWR
jgi:hypothetical protein